MGVLGFLSLFFGLQGAELRSEKKAAMRDLNNSIKALSRNKAAEFEQRREEYIRIFKEMGFNNTANDMFEDMKEECIKIYECDLELRAHSRMTMREVEEDFEYHVQKAFNESRKLAEEYGLKD